MPSCIRVIQAEISFGQCFQIWLWKPSFAFCVLPWTHFDNSSSEENTQTQAPLVCRQVWADDMYWQHLYFRDVRNTFPGKIHEGFLYAEGWQEYQLWWYICIVLYSSVIMSLDWLDSLRTESFLSTDASVKPLPSWLVWYYLAFDVNTCLVYNEHFGLVINQSD